jgi:murein DD-endopeptidase MepM/ murein hydrolase activator NlpD
MLRKRYYIVFVSRDDDGRLRKIPLPIQYVYGFVAAALVGAFTIVGLAGSYTRMLLKTESYNQVRQERETLRKDYKQMAQIAHDRDVQVASLGALANEVTALYGLRQNKLATSKAAEAASAAAQPTPASLGLTDEMDQQQVKLSIDQFYTLRAQALSGRITRALESGLSPSFIGDWTELADAPSLWPLEGRVGSSFGERQDPINGEGAFHSGIDIEAPYGTPVRAAVVPGQHVSRGEVIGYVGQSGRATGPHLHYEVRVHRVPVNPHKYLHTTYDQMALTDMGAQGSR